jgi:hypothetical protein
LEDFPFNQNDLTSLLQPDILAAFAEYESKEKGRWPLKFYFHDGFSETTSDFEEIANRPDGTSTDIKMAREEGSS